MPFTNDSSSIFNNYYLKILEQTTASGSLADEYYKGLERLENLRKQNAPNLQDEVNKFVGWMRQNQEGILGRPPETTPRAATGSPTTSTGPATTATTSSDTVSQGEEITQQQKDLFRKLHGTSYNPNSSMDKTKMSQLQSAGSEVGYDDVNKLTNTAYAKQYAGTPQGDAYAKRANPTPPAANNTASSTSPQTTSPNEPFSLTSTTPIKMNLSSPVGLAGNTTSSPVKSTTATKAPLGTNAPAPKAPKAPLSNKKKPNIT